MRLRSGGLPSQSHGAKGANRPSNGLHCHSSSEKVQITQNTENMLSLAMKGTRIKTTVRFHVTPVGISSKQKKPQMLALEKPEVGGDMD